MSTNKLRKEGVDCYGGICGLEACKKHTVEVWHVATSDTVSIHVDGEYWHTYGDSIWNAILDLEKIPNA